MTNLKKFNIILGKLMEEMDYTLSLIDDKELQDGMRIAVAGAILHDVEDKTLKNFFDDYFDMRKEVDAAVEEAERNYEGKFLS